ncbi:MAG: hypothetical protein Q8N05_05725 [Bacteroidota bacterium]|nr:hypothetical protein [Bacteroidota bacterium]
MKKAILHLQNKLLDIDQHLNGRSSFSQRIAKDKTAMDLITQQIVELHSDRDEILEAIDILKQHLKTHNM